MQRVTIKILIFLIIGSTCLLPVIGTEVLAQKTTPPQSQPVQVRAVTIKALKSRQIAIENMTGIDPSLKADSLDYIDRAIRHLELADATNKKAIALSQLIRTAPGRIKMLQAELKKTVGGA